MSDCNLQQRDDGLWHCPECDPGQQRLLPVPAQRNCSLAKELLSLYPEPLNDSNRGMHVGTQLHNLLYDRFGVDIVTGCACKAWIDTMNKGGPTWCRVNIDSIVSKMLSEANRRNWQLDGRPLLSKVAKIGTVLPWGMAFARTWARKLVLEAIEICERENEKTD